MSVALRALAVLAIGAVALAALPVSLAVPLTDVEVQDDGGAVVAVDVPGVDVPPIPLLGADPLGEPEPAESVESDPQDRLPTELVVPSSARWGVAVLEPATGLAATWGDPGPFDTASAVKVDVLATLLLRAQREDRRLTREERRLARAMITLSDNDATTALVGRVGGLEEVAAFHERSDVEGVDLAGEGDADWGLTRSTPQARVDVLEALLESPLLTPRRRDYAARLLSAVVEDQRFGVSAAADDPAATALKVGFVPDDGDDEWTVTSAGRVVTEGRTLLLAVMTDGNAGYEEGVELTEVVARRAVAAVSVASAEDDLSSRRPPT